MKTYTLEVVISTGNDEFWEGDPTNDDVVDLLSQELFYFNPKVKMKKVVEECEDG